MFQRPRLRDDVPPREMERTKKRRRELKVGGDKDGRAKEWIMYARAKKRVIKGAVFTRLGGREGER